MGATACILAVASYTKSVEKFNAVDSENSVVDTHVI